MKLASKEGLSLNLLTRGLGFGYMGSALTSFIYAINFIFYFLFEGTIVSHAIANYYGIAINSFAGIAIFSIIGLFAIFFVWKGMTSLQFLQTWAAQSLLSCSGFVSGNWFTIIPLQDLITGKRETKSTVMRYGWYSAWPTAKLSFRG